MPVDDSTLFLAVVESVRQSAAPESVEIDPRPLRADPSVLEANPLTLAKVAEGTVEARRGVLRRLGISPADNPTYQNCPGVLTPPPLPGQRDPKENCPDRTFYVAAIGLPRPGGAYIRIGAVDEREAGLRAGHVAIRVLLTHLQPQGASMTAYDYVFKRDSTGWSLVKKVPLVVSE